jgi:hypothetical protein
MVHKEEAPLSFRKMAQTLNTCSWDYQGNYFKPRYKD